MNPKEFLAAIGYERNTARPWTSSLDGSRMVGLYCIPPRDWGELPIPRIVDSKGERDLPEDGAVAFLEAVQAMGRPPNGVALGMDADEPANYWIVIDRTKNEWLLMPAPVAKNIVTGRPIKPGEIPTEAPTAPPMMQNYYDGTAS